MAFLEIRNRIRLREKIKGKFITIIPDLGTDEKNAERVKVDYERAKSQGFVVNPASQNIVRDIDAFLRAKAQGINLNEPAETIADAKAKWLAASTASNKTKGQYGDSVDLYCAYSGATSLDDLNVDRVNAWRVAMEDGSFTFTRGGKDAKGNLIRYRYSPHGIRAVLSGLRIFCNYCVGRGWMSTDPANKAKPLNPFVHIPIKMPQSIKRFLTRSEAARLLWACRLEKFAARGNTPVPQTTLDRIAELTSSRPELGKYRLKRVLAKEGIIVSLGSIERLWERNNLSLERQRRALGGAKISFTFSRTVIKNKRANSRLRKWIHFGLYSGMREDEVRRARCEHIISHQIVGADGSIVTVYGLHVLEPKGGPEKMRTVWFSPNASRVHGLRKKFGTSGPLLVLASTTAMAKARRLAAKRAGLGRVRFHDLRHSFARNFLLSETGKLSGLQKALGHSRLSTTGIYSNFENTDLAAPSQKYRVR